MRGERVSSRTLSSRKSVVYRRWPVRRRVAAVLLSASQLQRYFVGDGSRVGAARIRNKERGTASQMGWREIRGLLSDFIPRKFVGAIKRARAGPS